MSYFLFPDSKNKKMQAVALLILIITGASASTVSENGQAQFLCQYKKSLCQKTFFLSAANLSVQQVRSAQTVPLSSGTHGCLLIKQGFVNININAVSLRLPSLEGGAGGG